jgi:hypothetical protein
VEHVYSRSGGFVTSLTVKFPEFAGGVYGGNQEFGRPAPAAQT